MITINYMGSKNKLLSFLEDCFSNYEITTFVDAFSGSVRVAYHFRNKYDVIVNDKLSFSKIIAQAYMINNKGEAHFKKYIDELNSLSPIHGWFSEKYGGLENGGSAIVCPKTKRRGVWLLKNANKIDAIRQKIDEYEITECEKSVLLLSLIVACKRVSNTLGHQNGYLKNWAKNCYNDLHLELPPLEKPTRNHEAHHSDIYELLPHINADLIYFDPPYGTMNKNLKVSTRYSSFYHLWNTLVLNHQPITFGRANKPILTKGWTPSIEKNEKEIVMDEFKKLIRASNSKYVAFSYSNHGLLSKDDFYTLFESIGCKNVDFYETGHGVNNQKNHARKDGLFIDYSRELEPLKEYLFVIKKGE